MMELNKGFYIEIGTIHGHVFGGPFKKFVPGTRRLVGVKMAAEIDHPHDISIPTEDYCVPEKVDLERGIIEALKDMQDGNDVYVGCMGGVGRTGLFMGCLLKCMNDLRAKGIHADFLQGNVSQPAGWDDPVAAVRMMYNPHAIETAKQRDYVRTFDSSTVVFQVEQMLKPVVKEVEVVRTVSIPVKVRVGLIPAILGFCLGLVGLTLGIVSIIQK